MIPSKRSQDPIADILRFLAEVDHVHLNDGTIVDCLQLSDALKRPSTAPLFPEDREAISRGRAALRNTAEEGGD